jgi:uncharacterized membrane protein
MSNQAIILEMQKKSTSHVLHLILSICTLGWWVIVWILCAVHTSHVNYHLDEKIKKVMSMEARA